MKPGRMVALLLGLGFMLSTAAGAQEPAAEPLLVAHRRALDHRVLVLPVAGEAAPAARENQSPSSLSLDPGVWSPRKAAAALAAGMSARGEPDAAPRFSFVMRNEEPRLSLVRPLPRGLAPTAFRESRLRGPFEQVYPRLR